MTSYSCLRLLSLQGRIWLALRKAHLDCVGSSLQIALGFSLSLAGLLVSVRSHGAGTLLGLLGGSRELVSSPVVCVLQGQRP